MERARIFDPEYPIHVFQRGHCRNATFLDDQDFFYYLKVARRAADAASIRVHAYVLMTNHFHFLISSERVDGPANFFQRIGSNYVRYFNRKYSRSGSLWESRFKSRVIDTDDYYFTCSRYIELNPVMAGMVSLPGDYRWSSYQVNSGLLADPIVSHHDAYLSLAETPTARAEVYCAMVNECVSD